jgi:hypothetical protein
MHVIVYSISIKILSSQISNQSKKEIETNFFGVSELTKNTKSPSRDINHKQQDKIKEGKITTPVLLG